MIVSTSCLPFCYIFLQVVATFPYLKSFNSFSLPPDFNSHPHLVAYHKRPSRISPDPAHSILPLLTRAFSPLSHSAFPGPCTCSQGWNISAFHMVSTSSRFNVSILSSNTTSSPTLLPSPNERTNTFS